MAEALGRHVLCDAYGCDSLVLNDVAKIERVLVDSALKAGAEVREVALHKFSPQGVSGIIVISESHLAIHTWPELGYAALDVFTCGEKVDPWVACKYVVEALQAVNVITNEVKRGTNRRLEIEDNKN